MSGSEETSESRKTLTTMDDCFANVSVRVTATMARWLCEKKGQNIDSVVSPWNKEAARGETLARALTY